MSTSIGWTRGDDGTEGDTWNPVRGCALTSTGCEACYAMKQAHRFSGPGRPYDGLTRLRTKGGPVWTGEVRLVSEKLCEPLSWQRGRRVFVCQHYADERIPHLLRTPAAIRFVSAEPLLGPTDVSKYLRRTDTGPATFHAISPEMRALHGDAPKPITLTRTTLGVDWVIVGGESGGLDTRPFDPAWGSSLVAQCKDAGVPIFVKQLGSWRRYREFSSYQQWVDKAHSWIGGTGAKLVDTLGRTRTNGTDMKLSWIEQTFPVTAFVHEIDKGDDAEALTDASIYIQEFPKAA